MSKHYTNKELIEFTNGTYPVQKLAEISKHIARCSPCKDSLESISPTFINHQFAEMNNERHFSEGELVAFLKAEIPLKSRLQMSEHLRNCPTCKTKLYAQNPQFLKQTIATYLNKEEPLPKKTFFSSLNILVPIGAMAVLLIAVLFFVLPKREPLSLQTKVNKAVENPSLIPISPSNQTMLSSNNNLENPPRSVEINPPTIVKRQPPKVVTKEIVKTKKIIENKLPNSNKVAISESRSSNSNCENEDKVTVISPNFEKITDKQPTFRWKRFPQATKYNIYISDTAQILIEEAEVINETSYKLKTSLELDKPYKWSVVATTADGKTFPSQSTEFSLGKKAQKFKISKERNKTRCLKENGKLREK